MVEDGDVAEADWCRVILGALELSIKEKGNQCYVYLNGMWP